MIRFGWIALSFVLITSSCLAQITFKKGYFIDKDGNKTECLIKDVDWKNSPSSFAYKLTEEASSQKMSTDGVKEFAAGDTKYIRADVKYDQSPQDLRKLNSSSSPDWVDASVLLRVVVEGKATLYHYNTSDLSLLFLSVNKGPIEQLVYKSYTTTSREYILNNLLTDLPMIGNNQLYLSQLRGKVRCEGMAPITLQRYPYQVRPISRLVKEFNSCSGGPVTEEKNKQKSFSFSLAPGVDFTNALGQRGTVTTDFGDDVTLRLGADLQFALPLQKGKWTIIFTPAYQSFKGMAKSGRGLEYQLIEFPFGVRHRFFLSEKSWIFVNVLGLLDFPLKHVESGPGATKNPVQEGSFGYAAGGGFAFGRFSLEGRYYAKRKRNLGPEVGYDYTKSSIILGFRLTK